MKKNVLALMLFLSTLAFGQTEQAIKPLPTKPFIEVTGTATTEIVPDKIFISITLTNKIIDKQQYNIENQETQLKIILTKNNIELSRLTLNDANSDILIKRRKEVGYEVKKVFTLQLSTAEQVSKISKELQDLYIKEMSIVKLEHSKIDSIRKEVRIEAIKAAKNKAEYLLAAIGEQLDKPQEIREVIDESFYRDNRSFVSNTTSRAYNLLDDAASEIAFDKIKISFSYFIKYSIK